MFCICIDVYKYYESNDNNEIYEALSTLKNKKIKMNSILIENDETSDFEQMYWSRTATGIYKIGHDNLRKLKWIRYYDRPYDENINYYDLLGSIRRYNTINI